MADLGEGCSGSVGVVYGAGAEKTWGLPWYGFCFGRGERCEEDKDRNASKKEIDCDTSNGMHVLLMIEGNGLMSVIAASPSRICRMSRPLMQSSRALH